MADTFTLTAEHIKLVGALYARDDNSECEVGAPEFDGKRPYGNSSHLIDIVELLHGQEAVTDGDGSMSEEAISEEHLEEAKRLHAEIGKAFAVVWNVLVAGGALDGIEPSEYAHSYQRGGWYRA